MEIAARATAETSRVLLGDVPLDVGTIAALSRGPARVALSATAWQRVRAAHLTAVAVAVSQRVYGRSTGVGANKGTVAGPEHAERLLASHATGAGPSRSTRRVRAMALVRVRQLAAGGAGVSPELVEALLDAVERDRWPEVPDGGSLGTGDLAPLARLVEYLAGRRPDSAGGFVEKAVPVGVHDALPALSSGAATLADAALAVDDLTGLLEWATRVTALTFHVTRASVEAVGEPVARRAPTEQVARVAREVARLLEPGADREVVGLPGRTRDDRPVQDCYALRCAPQVLGAAIAGVDLFRNRTEGHVNAGLENPLVDPQDGVVVHHGGFYALDLAMAADHAVLGVTAAAAASQQRLGLLLDGAVTGLPDFLTDGAPGASGAMLLEYAAADAVAELRVVAAPSSLSSVSVSRGAEESSPGTSLAVRQTLRAVPLLRRVLACELVAAVRALGAVGGPGGLPPALAVVLADCVEVVGPRDGNGLEDRDLSPDVVLAERVLLGAAADG